MIRLLKIVLALFIALLCLFYALQNLFNLDSAFAVVGAILQMANHEYYPAHFGPPVVHPALVWFALSVIIALEFLAGLLAARGSWDMWTARKASGEVFQASKYYVAAGVGLALVVWFGLFAVIGGAYFQMWQTELGADSLAGAFQYAVGIAIVYFYVHLPDPD